MDAMNRRWTILALGSALLASSCSRSEPDKAKPNNAASAAAPTGSAPAGAPQADAYTCPMHPEVVKPAPGRCPICGMDLVKKESAAPQHSAH